MFLFFQQQITSFQTEKNRLSLTLEERTEQERAEQTKTLERLEQELDNRGKAEAAAAEAERQRQVLAVDLKDMHQKFERIQQEYNALLDKVHNESVASKPAIEMQPKLGCTSPCRCTVVYSVSRPMIDSETAGDLVLIQTSLFLSVM